MTLTSNIHFRSGDMPGARYLSGRVTYDEQFRAGRLCTRYWSPSGQVWARDAPAKPALAARPARPIHFNCRSTASCLQGGYEWVDAQITPDTSGYRAGGETVVHGVITLLHRATQTEVKVHTRIDGGPFIIRWLEITNRAAQTVGITSVAPFQRRAVVTSGQRTPGYARWFAFCAGLCASVFMGPGGRLLVRAAAGRCEGGGWREAGPQRMGQAGILGLRQVQRPDVRVRTGLGRQLHLRAGLPYSSGA